MQDTEDKKKLLILSVCALTQTSKTLIQSNKQKPKEKPNRTNTASSLRIGVLKHSLLKY